MGYIHTQKGPLHYFLFAVAAVLIVSAQMSIGQPSVTIVLGVVAGIVVLFAFCFRTLTIFDEGMRLSLQYGPLPLFRKSIDYSNITSVEPGLSSIIDGWGIHWVPGRGWTYNLWGFDCVILHLGNSVIRIGTSDVDNLVNFLEQRIASDRG
ncbi:MAG: hypothetical protein ACR2NU_00010 [Aeoliella sp.]